MKSSEDIIAKPDFRSNFGLFDPIIQKKDFSVDSHLCQFQEPIIV